MKRSPQKSPPTDKRELRIIGGQWRGRKLSIANIEGLRPTGDRIRETLFNWLMHDVVDSHCLDLFSGSGALGFEALSRGAQRVVMVEKSREASLVLQQHCKKLDTSSTDIINNDALTWLNQYQGEPFDIVFIDPPFALDLWQATIQLLDEKQCLKPNAMVYIETPKDTIVTTPAHWQLYREKSSGAVCYRLFQCL